ncbi:MAG: hypothetical protein MJA82_18680, partial [Clostridia bacterium]|nr:hypothetical protein [Clostridia bacterium]
MNFSLSKSKKTGIILLIVAVVLIAGAFLGNFILIKKYAEQDYILVAKYNIMPGNPVSKEDFDRIKIPKKAIPSDAIRPDDIQRKEFKGHIAISEFAAKDILRWVKVADMKQTNLNELPTISLRLRAIEKKALNNIDFVSDKLRQMRAAEIPIDSVEGILPKMKIGDIVSITSVYIDDEASKLSDKEVKRSEVLFEYIPIIDLINKNEKIREGSLSVALTKDQMRAFALARDKGKFHIALMPFGIKKPLDYPEIISVRYKN